jgi:hypothetical protein
MNKLYVSIVITCISLLLVSACRKEEADIKPQEKMLTSRTWVVAEVYVNDQRNDTPPQGLADAKVKFTSASPAGTVYLNGSQYPVSYWAFDPATADQITINPGSQAAVSASITRLESQSLWLKFQKEVPFLGFQLAPSTELRMVPE